MQKKAYKITCFGACTIDEYVALKKKRPGGGGLNALVHFRKLLPNSVLHSLSAIGKDKDSKIIINTLNKNTILTTNLQALEGNASVQHIKNLPNGEKVFFNFQAGVLETASVVSSK